MLAVFLALLLMAGCQEENSAQARKIKLENFELKNVIKQKDAEIVKLKSELAECKKERKSLQKGVDEEIVGALQELAASAEADSSEIEKLRQENKALKEMIKLLGAKKPNSNQ